MYIYQVYCAKGMGEILCRKLKKPKLEGCHKMEIISKQFL